MAEAFEVRELVQALNASDGSGTELTVNDLPKEMLVSLFMAVGDERWVRYTVPLVCRDWAALYRSQDASPLHEKLEVDFDKELAAASAAARAAGRPRRVPQFDHRRVTAWARRYAGSVRDLCVESGASGGLGGLSAGVAAAWLAGIVAVVGPSLTEIAVELGELCKRDFWEALRTCVVPAGRLFSFAVEGDIDFASSGLALEALGQQLGGSLYQVFIKTDDAEGHFGGPRAMGLPRFPESLCALTELRNLVVAGHSRIKAIPAGISSLKKLNNLDLRGCDLSSLPKELGELSGLTQLILGGNEKLGKTAAAFPAELGGMKSLRVLHLHGCGLREVPAFVGEIKSLESLTLCCNDISSLPKELGELSALINLVLSNNQNLGTALPAAEAFPAELKKIKSLRWLHLDRCGLRAVPAFVREQKSLESLNLGYNDLRIDAPLDFLIEGCPRLWKVSFYKGGQWPYSVAVPWTPKALAHLEAFKANLRAKNPRAQVSF